MKLEEIMDVMNENAEVKIYDNNEELIATYNGKDNIPAVFNDVEVTYVTTDYESIMISIHYDNNLKAIDYLKDRLADIPETIACDEYHYDNPDSVNQRIMDGLANVADYIRIIRYNIDRGLPWDDGMYI